MLLCDQYGGGHLIKRIPVARTHTDCVLATGLAAITRTHGILRWTKRVFLPIVAASP